MARPRAQAITRALLAWYSKNHRTLPWRTLADPYSTWVSEIMLQQTQVATVVPYFERWMKRFPTVGALARAPEDEVLSAWQGLGYYSRARNLQRCAQVLVERYDGFIPSDPRLLEALPGIGRYTAGAIASIAFDRPVPAVDGNVERVVARLEALRGLVKQRAVIDRIRAVAAALVECGRPSLLNQALMELGALVCTPEAPRCETCPLRRLCRARALQLSAAIPERAERVKPTTRRVVVLLVSHGDRLLFLRQPPSAAHWAGLFALPYEEYDAPKRSRDAARRYAQALDPDARMSTRAPLTTLSYPITRYRFEADAYLVVGILLKRAADLGGCFASFEQASQLALPAPHRRLCDRYWTRG